MRFKYIVYILFGISFLSFITLYSVDNKNSFWVDIYKNRLENHIHKYEKEIQAVIKDTSLIQRMVTPFELLTSKDQDIYRKELETLNNKNFTFLIYKNDSLIFWSKSMTESDLSFLKEDLSQPTTMIQLQNGIFLNVQKNIQLYNEKYSIYGLLPIKQNFVLESEYLKNEYISEINIPSTIPLTINGLGKAIKSIDNSTIAFIPNNINFNNITHEKLLLAIYILTIIFFVGSIHILIISLFSNAPPYIKEILLILFIFVGRYIMLFIGYQDAFQNVIFFNILLKSPLFEINLGDLLINICLFFYAIINMSGAYSVKKDNQLTKSTKFILSILLNLFIVIGIYVTIAIIKSIVNTPQIPFDFENVFRLNIYSFSSVTGIIVLNFSFFLLSYGLLKIQNDFEISKNKKLLIPIISILISIIIIPYFHLEVKTSILILVAFIFIILLDLFSENQKPNIGWIVTWLIILSTFSSTFLYKFNTVQDLNNRKEIISHIINEKNNTVLNELQIVKQDIEKRNNVYKIDSTCTHCNQEKIYTYIKNSIKKVHHLNINYDNFLYFLDTKYKNSNFENERMYKEFIESEITDYDNILVNKSTPLNEIFFIKFDKKNAPKFFLVFKKKEKDESKLYTELLLTSNKDVLNELSKYDYKVVNKGKTIFQKGNFSHNNDSSNFIQDKITTKYYKNYSVVSYKKDTLFISISRPFDSINKIISLFSYFFSLYILFILLLVFINTIFKQLPNSINLVFNKKPSLRDKIQFSVIAIIVLSFIIIGIVTVFYFKTSTENYHEARLERKTRAIQRDLEHELAFSNVSDFELNKPDQWIMPISEIHRLDINIFDMKGNLISTSEKDILDAGIISTKMNPLALLNLSQNGVRSLQLFKTIGNLTYKVAYTPLINNKNVPMGYLALPYYSKQRKLREDVSGFMGALLNVYVFLLLIASVIAIAVANSITKPISVIGSTLSKFKLMGQNKPLVWHSSDEVGQLINEYNNMIAKLDKSTELLLKSEREGAWREMAKQVAHEIKNPLTPMKLSIQHLNRAIKSGVENKEELIDKVTNRLIEQIDILAEIATEFSNFAKMPKSTKEETDLKIILSSVYNLFNDSQALDIKLHMTPYEVTVFADKNQLARVFNNLISNSIQAIQTVEKGKISIYLTIEDKFALLKFTDNGIGIKEDMKKNIFKPYFTTKSSGTGLGLVMSQKIIEDCNGEIYFESKPDISTSFFIKIPIQTMNEND